MAQEFSYKQPVSEPAPEIIEAKEKKPDFLKDVESKVRSSYVGARQKVEQFQKEQHEKRAMTVKSRLEKLERESEVDQLEAKAMDLEDRRKAHKERKKEAFRERVRSLFSFGGDARSQPVRYARGARQPRAMEQRQRPIYEGSSNAAALLSQGAGSNAGRLLLGGGSSNAARLLFSGGGSNASRLLFSNRSSNASRLLMGGRREAQKPSLLSMMTGRRDIQKRKRGITIHIRR